MAQNFLISSRHGSVFYFRRRVPTDLKWLVGKAFLVKSLATNNKTAAIVMARAYAVKTDAFFNRLRTMKKLNPDSIAFDYTVEFSLDDDGSPKFKIDATAAETPSVNALVSNVLQNLPGSGRAPHNSASTPTLTPQALLEDFFREGVGSGRWKNAERTKSHEYQPIWAKFAPIADQHGLSVKAAKHYRAEILNSNQSLETKNRNLYRIHAVIKFGVDSHDLDEKMLKELKMPGVKGRGKNSRAKPYQPFTQAELERLFHSPAYQNNSFKKPSHYWLPLLGLYTGARIEELAGLHLSVFDNVDCIPAVTLSDEVTTDGGKNEYALRQIPIHQQLVDAGLLLYVDQLRSEGSTRLFPDIGNAERDGFGKRATADFIDYRRSVAVGNEGGGRSRKVFHSFRSTLAGKFYASGIDGDLSRRLTGHAAVDTHQDTYLASAPIPMKLALAAINKISFGLTHPPFSDTAAYVKARNRKKRE